MNLWNLIYLLSLLVSPSHCVECPFYCQCYQQSGINSIFCINVSRQYIPNYFDFDVKIFNFSGNSLQTLTPLAFQNQHYKSLEILDIRRNGIAKIDDRAFRRLKNLLEIDLSNNLIHFINRKMFNNNRFLNTVILSGNPITEIKDYTFPPSIYLRHLDFQGCRIEKIHKLAFVNSPLVEYINLKDNNLKSLSVTVLHYTTQLKSLMLDGNPWRCNRKLWLVLKWLHDRNVGKDSMLCVYGETENAILWDTMDLNHPTQFQKYSDTGEEKIKWTQGSKRSRRSSVDRVEILKSEFDKSSYSDFDYPKVDDPVEPEDEKTKKQKELEFNKHRYNQKNFKHPEYNPVTFKPYPSTPKGFKQYGWKLINGGGELPDDSNSKYDFNKPHHEESSTGHHPLDYQLSMNNQRKTNIPWPGKQDNYHSNQAIWPENVSHQFPRKQEKPVDILKTQSISKFIPVHAIKANNEVVHIFHTSEDIDKTNVVNPLYNINELDNRTNAIEGGDHGENASSLEDTVPNEESVNMNIMLILIAIEFTLLLVLLYILYKLWKWNRGGNEHGVNTPLNSSSKSAKTYNTGSPGYMRYSLSDDDPSVRNNTPEDGKFDAESGYLSYHRYNSIEGENNNDFMFYRHYPRDENTTGNTNTDTSINSVFERRPQEDVDGGVRSIRRHSSIRSIGRSAKVNTFTRSVSADKADQYCSLGADNADQHRSIGVAHTDRHCSTSADEARQFFSTANGTNQYCSTVVDKHSSCLTGTDI